MTSESQTAKSAVFVESVQLPADMPLVEGYDFNKGNDLAAVLENYYQIGFQATELGKAINLVREMVSRSLS